MRPGILLFFDDWSAFLVFNDVQKEKEYLRKFAALERKAARFDIASIEEDVIEHIEYLITNDFASDYNSMIEDNEDNQEVVLELGDDEMVTVPVLDFFMFY